jgi:type VI secretion system secreted protein Hcp
MAKDNFLYFPAAATGGLLVGKAAQPEGETTDDWFSKKKAVELNSWQFAVTQAHTSGSGTTGSAAGKAKFEKIVIEKDVDQATSPLFAACAAGAHYPDIMIIVRKPGGSNLLFLQFIFMQVYVTKCGWNGGSGEENPKESIEFTFGAMGMQYIQQLGTGAEGKKMIGLWSTTANNNTLTVPAGTAAPPWLDGSQA